MTSEGIKRVLSAKERSLKKEREKYESEIDAALRNCDDFLEKSNKKHKISVDVRVKPQYRNVYEKVRVKNLSFLEIKPNVFKEQILKNLLKEHD